MVTTLVHGHTTYSIKPDEGSSESGGDRGESPYYGSPYYALTDGDTSGHDGDVEADEDITDLDSTGGTPHCAPTDGGSAASEGLSPVTPTSVRDAVESSDPGAESDGKESTKFENI